MKSGKIKRQTMKVRRHIFTIVGIALLVTLIMSANVLADIEEHPYLVKTSIGEDGKQIDKVIVSGRPPAIKAKSVVVPETDIASGIKVLEYVPAYYWSYGCSATSGAMMAGYYDNNGYSKMYKEDEDDAPMNNSGWGTTVYDSVTCGECPLSATHLGVDGRTTRGHVDDYWIDYLSGLQDPFIGNWDQHEYGDCTGDYMKTNQYNYGNDDGSTTFWFYTDGTPLHASDFEGDDDPKYMNTDGGYGLHSFFESRGYTVTDMYNQYVDNKGKTKTNGFTFAQYKDEIDANRPVLIHVRGHTMLGYGYDDATNTVYLHDTWDYGNHSMIWGKTYVSLKHYGVTVIELEPLETGADAS